MCKRLAALLFAFCPLTLLAQPNPAIAKLQHDIPFWLQQTGIPGASIALIRSGRTEWLGTFG